MENFGKKLTEEERGAISRRLDKISETDSALTDRSLSVYLREFNLLASDLSNKKILDIGSGDKERFSKEAAEIGAEIYSLNPALQKEEMRKEAKENIASSASGEILAWQKRTAVGRGQELPFGDEVFDMITSLYAVPYYIDSKQGKFDAIREMVRVLKPGGRILIGPGVGAGMEHKRLEDLLGTKAMDWLKNHGCALEAKKWGHITIKKLIPK